jgi:anti-sigma factor RsiW
METKPYASLGDALRDGSLYERAPVYLREQVLAAIREESRKKRRLEWPWTARAFGLPFVGGGVMGAALCSLVLMMVFWTPLAVRSDDVGQEVVASHVRALISSRPIDVISTDQHTVKPWFNGRIDYAPPVIDPREQGFPLVGGRLDYVDHRPVAVMVYRYLKHPIDLYVFPESTNKATSSPSAPTAMHVQSREGYSLVEWHQNGMTYWAISDASATYVKQFASAISEAAGH